MNRGFWKGKRVLVTGHTGFKGSWLCLMLEKLDAEIFGFSLSPDDQASMFELIGLEAQLNRHCLGDIRNFDQVREFIQYVKPEIIFHLAASSLVIPALKLPTEAISTNVLGTTNLLEAFRNLAGKACFINVTTDKCYFNEGSVWPFRETDRLGGKDPYSGSKACAEIIAETFWHAYLEDQGAKGLACVRAGNVIGGGDFSPYRLIPDLVRAIKNQCHLEVRNPESVRPWQHVLEPLTGYITLAEKLYEQPRDFSGPWNFGPAIDDSLSVMGLLDEFKIRFPELRYKTQSSDYKEAHSLQLDSTKAKSMLGWRTRWNSSTTVGKTAQWFQAYLSGSTDLHSLTNQQISDFFVEAK